MACDKRATTTTPTYMSSQGSTSGLSKIIKKREKIIIN
jgi:hypothetical protein